MAPMKLIADLEEAKRHLLQEAEFNRSWTDGRRPGGASEEYVRRRTDLAAERERWAAAIDFAAARIHDELEEG